MSIVIMTKNTVYQYAFRVLIPASFAHDRLEFGKKADVHFAAHRPFTIFGHGV
jgi:hypothetical protein